MSKIILSINAGSSSVKISIYSATQNSSPVQLAETQISGLTAPPPLLDYTRAGTPIITSKTVTKDPASSTTGTSQDDAFKILLDTLISDPLLPEISSEKDIAIATHRIVHGGSYKAHKVITPATYHRLEELNDLAPLHNTAALQIVRSCVALLPGCVNVAHFDTQFHATLPRPVYTYAIDQGVARKNKLRKYGFHGISYAFIVRAVAEHLGKKTGDVNLIVCHLGSGASVCAVKGGRSWDTSMGLTPLAGLPGATRSGNVDPSLVFHYASDVGKLCPNSTSDLHISRAEEILNKEAGWKALTGTTNFGAISGAVTEEDLNSGSFSSYGPAPGTTSTTTSTAAAAKKPGEEDKKDGEDDDNTDGFDPSNPMHAKKLAFDIFVDRISAFIGSYYVSLSGDVDALVFSAGIGEKSPKLRTAVVGRVKCLGFGVDEGKNGGARVGLGNGDGVVDITAGMEGDMGGKVRHRTLVCATDEQFEMARECAEDGSLW